MAEAVRLVDDEAAEAASSVQVLQHAQHLARVAELFGRDVEHLDGPVRGQVPELVQQRPDLE